MDEWQGIYKHFTVQEMQCKGFLKGKCSCGGKLPRHSFMLKLEQLREMCGFTLKVSSGFRCPQYNLRVADSGSDGPHTTGLAVDLDIRGTQAYLVLKYALELGFTGIGVSQKGKDRFLHLDIITTDPRPNIWSY